MMKYSIFSLFLSKPSSQRARLSRKPRCRCNANNHKAHARLDKSLADTSFRCASDLRLPLSIRSSSARSCPTSRFQPCSPQSQRSGQTPFGRWTTSQEPSFCRIRSESGSDKLLSSKGVCSASNRTARPRRLRAKAWKRSPA